MLEKIQKDLVCFDTQMKTEKKQRHVENHTKGYFFLCCLPIDFLLIPSLTITRVLQVGKNRHFTYSSFMQFLTFFFFRGTILTEKKKK